MNRSIVQIQSANHRYPVIIDRNVLDQIGGLVRDLDMFPRRIVIVSDRNVAGLYLQRLRKTLLDAGFTIETIILPPGEQTKSIRGFSRLIDGFIDRHITRDWGMAAFGGGVIGDAAGFAAATYLRGIPYVQIPTTLLSQIDSSVGGKTAIDHPRGKNLIGAFWPPHAVFADQSLLSTQQKRDVVSGLAEAIKLGIAADEPLFRFIETHILELLRSEPDSTSELVVRCITKKAEIVSEDEREAGRRVILNLGHTIGHAVETARGYGQFRHGEAVLAGLTAALFIAESRSTISSENIERVFRLLEIIPTSVSLDHIKFRDALNIIRQDKKNLQEHLRFVLPVSIGDVRIVDDLTADEIRLAFDKAKKYFYSRREAGEWKR